LYGLDFPENLPLFLVVCVRRLALLTISFITLPVSVTCLKQVTDQESK